MTYLRKSPFKKSLNQVTHFNSKYFVNPKTYLADQLQYNMVTYVLDINTFNDKESKIEKKYQKYRTGFSITFKN